MNRFTLLLASLALVGLPCAAETLRVKGELDSEPVTGKAQVDLSTTPASMRLSLAGIDSSLVGYPLEHGAYLFVEPPKADGIAGIVSEVVPTEKQRAVVVASLLNVRPGPALNTIPMRQVKRGDVLELSGVKSGPWIQLADGGSWVHGASRYVRTESIYDPKTISSAGAKLTLNPSSRGFYGTLEGSMDILRFVRVSPAGPPRVLLIPTVRYTAKEQRTLMGYALKLKRYYSQRGIKGDVHQADGAIGVIQYLEDAALAGRRYKRIVWIGHGGWDGPIMGKASPTQVSAKDHPEEFEEFVAALKDVLTPEGKMFASSCHAAGNNKFEKVMPYKSHYNWVHDLAKRTGHLVAGPAGITSTEYTYQHVLAILEGQGTVKQEVHVATGTTLRIVWPGRRLAGAKIQHLPEIRTTSNPPASTTSTSSPSTSTVPAAMHHVPGM